MVKYFKINIIVWIALALASLSSFAEPAAKLESVDKMASQRVYYTHEFFPFSDWKDETQLQILNLFPGFRDGISRNTPGFEGLKIGSASDIIVFLAKTRMLLPKASDKINLSTEPNFDEVVKFHDGLAQVEPLDPSEIETYRREKIFSYRNHPQSRWCDDGLCLKLNLLFDLERAAMITGFFCITEPGTCSQSFGDKSITDCLADPIKCLNGIRAQSELTMVTPKGPEVSQYQRLTGVETPIRSVITENIFWFNHILEFGKYVVVLQPAPHDKRLTLLSTFAVFSFDRKWWDRSLGTVKMQDIFLGASAFNGTEGLAQGLPPVLQQFTKKFGEVLIQR